VIRHIVVALLMLCMGRYAWAEIKRISGAVVNTGEVMTLYISPKLVSVIQAPCPLTENSYGSDQDIKVEISQKQANLAKIWLKKKNAEATNLILHCPKGSPLVFDIIPSDRTHQDYLRVVATYGGPELVVPNEAKAEVSK
jgi:hypothetical protein